MVYELSTKIAIALFVSIIALTTQALSAITTAPKTKAYNAIEQYFVELNITPPPPQEIIALVKQ